MILWHLNEESGGASADASPTGNGLRLVNNPQRSFAKFGRGLSFVGSSALGYYDSYTGSYGGYGSGFGGTGLGYYFGGGSPYAVSNTNLPIRTPGSSNEFTVQFWFNAYSPYGRMFQMANSDALGATLYDADIGWDPRGRLMFGVYAGGPKYAVASEAFTDGLWHLLTATLEPDAMRLYVDGKLAAENKSAASASAQVYGNGPRVWLGGASATSLFSDFAGQFYSGQIDEVRVLGRVRPADGVAADYKGAALKFSTDGGASYRYLTELAVSGFNGSKSVEASTAAAVPLAAGNLNRVAFIAQDMAGNTAVSSTYTISVKLVPGDAPPSGASLTTPPRASATQSVPSGSARMHSGRCNPHPMYCRVDLSMPKSRMGFASIRLGV